MIAFARFLAGSRGIVVFKFTASPMKPHPVLSPLTRFVVIFSCGAGMAHGQATQMRVKQNVQLELTELLS